MTNDLTGELIKRRKAGRADLNSVGRIPKIAICEQYPSLQRYFLFAGGTSLERRLKPANASIKGRFKGLTIGRRRDPQLHDSDAKAMSMASWFFGGRVSRYFSNAFSHIWAAGIGEDFLALRKQYPEYEVWITGHSLGGSLASLSASFLVGSHIAEPSKVKLVTFGQPRTGDSRFSEIHNNQLEYSFRVTHWRDIVPHIPMGPLGGYFHHRQQAFYKENMRPDDYKICDEGEAAECSDGLWFTASIDAHTHYFGRHVLQYASSGCAIEGTPISRLEVVTRSGWGSADRNEGTVPPWTDSSTGHFEVFPHRPLLIPRGSTAS
ncbi:triacylglycerol lipase [Teladorsagia circumcincta]|uniref:Triacylglycerol lipase n=1 Tax=Teladorsagia circumcincta TaxID=45464 RepID=A0A2G9USG4_TELCI|nr:triacylglycerol lipase [Teladorsagia circumcincta]